jgi:dTDP-4-dehydrorhamnose 3,5-epimerase
MRFSKTDLHSVYLIDPEPYDDERGSFSRIYCRQENAANGASLDVVQVNRSMNFATGTVRGLHFQTAPACETKRVTCIRGRIFDIILDIRKGSPTFLKWIGIELSEENKKTVHIPVGCAHGFQTLEPNTEVLYLHSAPFSPNHYKGIRYDDPRVNVRLPLNVTNISQRDANFPLLTSDFIGVFL